MGRLLNVSFSFKPKQKGPSKRPLTGSLKCSGVDASSENRRSACALLAGSVCDQTDGEVDQACGADAEECSEDKGNANHDRIDAHRIGNSAAYAHQFAIGFVEAKTALRRAAIVAGQIAHAITPVVKRAVSGVMADVAGTMAVAIKATVMIKAPTPATIRAAAVLER